MGLIAVTGELSLEGSEGSELGKAFQAEGTARARVSKM